jgi:8-oxo-dGTP diphosphatase
MSIRLIINNMKLRNKAIPAVYLLLEKEGKILVACRANTGYLDGHYQVPAGHVEESELPTEALIREAKEEIGIDLKPNDLEFVHVSYRPQHDHFFKPLKQGSLVRL